MLSRGMMFGATSPRNRQSGTAAIIAALAFVGWMALMQGIPWPQGSEPSTDGQVIIAGLGYAFVNQYVIPFLLLAMLLLVALAGAIVLARDRK